MAVKANNTHDISFIEPTNDKEIGLMLAWKTNSRGEKIRPLYAEYDDSTLSTQYYSGEPGYANLPPEKEVQLAQDDWRAGVGQEIYDTSDDKRYWKSINMDLRFKGLAQCAPLAVALSKDDGVIKAHCEYSGEMYIGNGEELQKLNATGDGWDDVETFDYDITDLVVYGGNLYVALGGDNKYEYTTAASADLTLRPTSNYATPYYTSPYGAASNWQCVDEASANDDTDYIYSTSTSASSYFNFPAHTTETGAINYVKMYARAKYVGTDGKVKITIYIGGTPYTGDFEDLTGSYANYSKQWDVNPATGAAWTWDEIDKLHTTDFAGVQLTHTTGVPRVTQFYIEVNYSTGDQTFITSSLSEADFFQVVDATLWKAKKPNELKKATDPTNTGSWGGAITVGSSTYNITALEEESGQVYVMKEDMPWYIDTSDVPHHLIPSLKALQSSTSGQNSVTWRGKLYIPCGTQSLVEYDSDATTFIDPADRCNNLTEYTGRVQAVTHDERWLFAVTDNSTKVELMATRLEVVDGTATRVWHPLCELTLANCQYAWVSNIYKKRLYISSTDLTEDLYYYPLPTDYGDLDSDTDYTFQTDGYFITPYHHANFKADHKAYIKLTLTMADTSADEYFTVHYRLKGTAAWTSIGNFKTEPTTTAYIPVDSNDVNPSGVMIQFKITAVTGDTSTTPKLLSYDCRGIWYPTKRKIIACSVAVADSLTPKKGGQETQTAAQIRTAIDAANAATWPIAFYDPWGNAAYVKFLNVEKPLTRIDKDRNFEEIYNLTLEKVTLS